MKSDASVSTKWVRRSCMAAFIFLYTTAAHAQSPGAPVPIDQAPTKTGTFQVTLTERSPLSKPADVAKRASQKLSAADADYDLTKETFETFVPKTPGDDGKYGLMVVMPFPAHGFPPRLWIPVLERRHLIWLGDNAAGDGRPPLQRIGLVLDAVHNAQKVWPIDASRVYLCPASASPVASGTALYYPDVFQGQICSALAGWYADMTDPKSHAIWKTNRFPQPRPEQLGQAKSRSRFFFAGRQPDSPGTIDPVQLVAKQGYERLGFKYVKVVSLPAKEITVWSAYPESWFEEGVEFLDAGAPAANAKESSAKTSAATTSTDKPAPAGSGTAAVPPAAPDDPARKAAGALSLAKNYIFAGQYEPARTKLKNLIQLYPTTPAAAEAQGLLKEIQDK